MRVMTTPVTMREEPQQPSEERADGEAEDVCDYDRPVVMAGELVALGVISAMASIGAMPADDAALTKGSRFLTKLL